MIEAAKQENMIEAAKQEYMIEAAKRYMAQHSQNRATQTDIDLQIAQMIESEFLEFLPLALNMSAMSIRFLSICSSCFFFKLSRKGAR